MSKELTEKLGLRREAFKLDDKDAVAEALLQTKTQMRSEVGRFSQAGVMLEESSSTIGGVFNEYLNYRGSIKRASQALGELKRRMETDDLLIWYSFCFFLSSVAFILSRRIGLITLLNWLLGWSYTLYASIVSFVPSLPEPLPHPPTVSNAALVRYSNLTANLTEFPAAIKNAQPAQPATLRNISQIPSDEL